MNDLGILLNLHDSGSVGRKQGLIICISIWHLFLVQASRALRGAQQLQMPVGSSTTIKMIPTEVGDPESVMLQRAFSSVSLHWHFDQLESFGWRTEVGRDNRQMVTISVEKVAEQWRRRKGNYMLTWVSLLTEFYFIDIASFHPTIAEYTFFSSTHKNSQRQTTLWAKEHRKFKIIKIM